MGMISKSVRHGKHKTLYNLFSPNPSISPGPFVSCVDVKQVSHREIYILCSILLDLLSNSYTMGCPPVRGDNPRALASGLSYGQVDNHGITILCHLHQCRPCTSRAISC